jgi:hypothetical protein
MSLTTAASQPQRPGDPQNRQQSLEHHSSHHALTTFPPLFHHVLPSRFFASLAFKLPKNTADKPHQGQQKPETHHNSPQTPNICFIHSQVVHPQRLTFLAQKRPQTRPEKESGCQSKEKSPILERMGLIICRRSPNLPHTYACSTIGPTRLNFRVRDGNGCDPRGKLTGKVLKSRSRDLPQLNRLGVDVSTLESSI